ncbi:hypothetical protein E4U55_000091 [Claviceps digitariae]|nr:hypothetical protein E4U55_000091 [Claviceps digitariae]
MRRTSESLLAFLAAVNICYAAENAPVVTDNPIDVIYTASLPSEPFFPAPGLSGGIKGFISASAPPDGIGVRFTVRFENLPKTGGPFPYHLHVNKAAGGNCTAAGAHLDSTNRGDKPPCDAGNLPSCQVGDLAGKYGKINSDPFTAEYVDKFLSLKEEDAAFFGNRSVVIHLANTTRITCADFVRGGTGFSSASPSASLSASPLPSATGGGNKSTISALFGNTTTSSTATRPVSSSFSSATVAIPVGNATPSSLPSCQNADGSCASEGKGNADKSACVSGSLAGCPSLSLSTRSSPSISPTTVLAAAGKMTPWSLAWWTCAIALFVGLS